MTREADPISLMECRRGSAGDSLAMRQGAGWTPNTAAVLNGPSRIILRNGLQLSPRLSFEKWLDVGRQLSWLTVSVAWCLGDWLVYGETAFNGRYRQAIEETSLDYQTLRNYAWVAKRFTMPRRRDSLSFGHHAEVAARAEPEQDYWLRKAEEFAWSRNRLRIEVRRSIRERIETGGRGSELPADNDSESVSDSISAPIARTLRLRIPAAQLDICCVAAAAYGLSLEEWALRTLETAAHEASRQFESICPRTPRSLISPFSST